MVVVLITCFLCSRITWVAIVQLRHSYVIVLVLSRCVISYLQVFDVAEQQVLRAREQVNDAQFRLQCLETVVSFSQLLTESVVLRPTRLAEAQSEQDVHDGLLHVVVRVEGLALVLVYSPH